MPVTVILELEISFVYGNLELILCNPSDPFHDAFILYRCEYILFL